MSKEENSETVIAVNYLYTFLIEKSNTSTMLIIHTLLLLILF